MDNYSDNSQNFLFYSSDDGRINVQVLVDNERETIWTTQKGMSEIFGVGIPAISKHLRNIFEEGELDYRMVISKMETTTQHGAIEGKTQKSETAFYSLDAIIAVGYRVNSYKATQFRIWATRILKEYLIKGFALDDERLKQGNRLFSRDFFKELVERIQEIRASERMFYEKITDIFKDCSVDYDPKSPISQKFYAEMQNKFHYAIHQHTAAELIKERADASKPYMGLTSWSNQKKGGKIYQSDTTNAKNYLSESELKGLNRLVNMFLDHAEHLAEKGKGTYTMDDWAKRLELFLNFNEYPLLTNAGKVRSDIAKQFAKAEYSKFRIIQDREYKSDFNRLVEATHNSIPIETDMLEEKATTPFERSLKKALTYNPRKKSEPSK
ncbi:virulence RhuM family protein [uncultured Rikenella sp.]|uniref:virulence RhuM family protein n=1 Tax=uncultured Rikenella sp. TaxID=368003 RepID=UPI0026218A4B|nr:virulence RhuM family protein [uncultured Rikenella sp.]